MPTKVKSRWWTNQAWVNRATVSFVLREEQSQDPYLRADRMDRFKVHQGKKWLREAGFFVGKITDEDRERFNQNL